MSNRRRAAYTTEDCSNLPIALSLGPGGSSVGLGLMTAGISEVGSESPASETTSPAKGNDCLYAANEAEQ